VLLGKQWSGWRIDVGLLVVFGVLENLDFFRKTPIYIRPHYSQCEVHSEGSEADLGEKNPSIFYDTICPAHSNVA